MPRRCETNARTVSLGELETLAKSFEEGVDGLETADLAFLGRTMELVIDKAREVYRLVEAESFRRLDQSSAELLVHEGSRIERKWSNQYAPDAVGLYTAILQLDPDKAGDLFDYVPEQRTPPTMKVRNTTALKNWIEKLGLSNARHELERLLNAQKVNPKVTYRAIDSSTGEVL